MDAAIEKSLGTIRPYTIQVVYFRATERTSQPKHKKNWKNPPPKNSLYFRKWNFLALILKKILIFSQKKTFLVVSQKKAFLIHIVRLTIWHQLFLEFWLVDTWFFAHWRDQRVVTCLENVRQLNIRQGKKLGFQFSHRQPLYSRNGAPHFSPQAREVKEIDSRKISYTSGNGNPEKLLVFSKKKVVLTFQEMETWKKLYISGNRSPEKTSYILESNFPCSKNQKKLFIFHKRNFLASSLRKLLTWRTPS